MFPSLKICAIAIVTGVLAVGVQSPAFAKKGGVCATLNAINPDNDGTIDMNEAKQAASATFDRLDKDKDGTLSIAELQGRLSRKDFAAGDPGTAFQLLRDGLVRYHITPESQETPAIAKSRDPQTPEGTL